MSRKPSSLLDGLLATLGRGAEEVAWNQMADAVGKAIVQGGGWAVAFGALNPHVALPVMGLLTLLGIYRTSAGARDRRIDKAIHKQCIDLARKAAEGRDVLRDIADGTIELKVNVDDLVKDDIAAFVDRRMGAATSPVRLGLREDLSDMLSRYATPPQLQMLVDSCAAFQDTALVLLWTQDHRGREIERTIDALRQQVDAVLRPSPRLAWEEAKTVFRLGLELAPRDTRFLNDLAFLLSKQLGRGKEALALYSEGLQLDPDDPAMVIGALTLELVLEDRESGLRKLRALGDTFAPAVFAQLVPVILFLAACFEPAEHADGALVGLKYHTLATPMRLPRWDFAVAVMYARHEKHADADFLEMLAQVINGHLEPTELESWARWREL